MLSLSHRPQAADEGRIVTIDELGGDTSSVPGAARACGLSLDEATP